MAGAGVRNHNQILKRARARAEELEPKLAAVLEPILRRSGNEAARLFSQKATDFLTAGARRDTDLALVASLTPRERKDLAAALALHAAAYASSSTMVAVIPRPDEQAALADPGGEEASTLHITLAYLGDTEEECLPAILDALRPVAARFAPLVGVVGGVGSFGAIEHPDGSLRGPSILLPDVPGLVELRVAVTEALVAAGIGYGREHGFQPHITLSYSETPEAPADDRIGQPLHFDDLVLARGDVPTLLPLVGVPALTAAGKPKGERGKPQWSPPATDELVDSDKLVKQLRGKTDPVRLAVVETMTTEAVERVGLSFDVTNPHTAKVLAQSASQVQHIADTTRKNVRSIIDSSYQEGLSIPDTAKAIRVGMGEASVARATLIARTELAGVVNGGSLSATQIVADVTGEALYKAWMTGGGARFPRHELDDGLDGQTVPLDDYFSVGGYDLEYPGDPAGPPEEVCNCRCAIEYTDTLDGTAPPAEDLEAPMIDTADEVSELSPQELMDGAAVGDAAVSAALGDAAAVSDDLMAAYERYGGTGAKTLNRALRAGTASAKQLALAETLEASMVPLADDVIVYRGVAPGVIKDGVKLGEILEDGALLSTSSSSTVANRFTGGRDLGDVVFIRAAKGSKAISTRTFVSAEDDIERELIFPRGTRLRIRRVMGDTDVGRVFYAELIPGTVK